MSLKVTVKAVCSTLSQLGERHCTRPTHENAGSPLVESVGEGSVRIREWDGRRLGERLPQALWKELVAYGYVVGREGLVRPASGTAVLSREWRKKYSQVSKEMTLPSVTGQPVYVCVYKSRPSLGLGPEIA